MTDFQNYLQGSAPAYDNALGQSQQQQAPRPMTMEEWQKYLLTLTPEQLGEIKYKGPDFSDDSSNPLQKIMSMFGGKGKTAEGG